MDREGGSDFLSFFMYRYGISYRTVRWFIRVYYCTSTDMIVAPARFFCSVFCSSGDM